MARRLILLRHGDALWQSDGETDRERELSPVGVDQANAIGNALSEHGWAPDLVVASPARRAQATAQRVAETLGLPVSTANLLYEGRQHIIVSDIIAKTAPSVSTLMLVGHNPTFSELASALSATRVSLGTANAACLRVDATDWLDAGSHDARWALAHHLRPI